MAYPDMIDHETVFYKQIEGDSVARTAADCPNPSAIQASLSNGTCGLKDDGDDDVLLFVGIGIVGTMLVASFVGLAVVKARKPSKLLASDSEAVSSKV